MKRKKLKELTDTINFSRRVFDMDYFPDKPFSFFFLYVFTIKIYKSMKRIIYAANEDIQDKHFPIEKKREEKKNKISCNGRRIGPRGWIKRNCRPFSANLDVFSREFVRSILIPRKQAKRLGLAEFQDRGASAKSESATSSGMWDGSKRSVRRISGTGQTRRRSRVGQNQGSASFNNITIPDVLSLSLHPAADHPIYIANEQVLFLWNTRKCAG